MKKLTFILIFYAIVFFINQPAFAQQSRWQFVGRSNNGSVSYLETASVQQTGNERRTWTKDVFPDGSYKMSQADWRCREKRFRIRQTFNYDETAKLINTEKSSGWMAVVPDSVSENYYKAICSSSEQTTRGTSYSYNG